MSGLGCWVLRSNQLNLFDGVCVLACSASDECSQSTFWTPVRQFLAIGISFYFMVMKIMFMYSNMIDINCRQFCCLLYRVGLGCVGSIVFDLRWVVLGWVTQLMGWFGSGHRKWTQGQLWSVSSISGINYLRKL